MSAPPCRALRLPSVWALLRPALALFALLLPCCVRAGFGLPESPQQQLTIESVTPRAAPAKVQTSVKLRGSGFASLQAVRFGGSLCTSLVIGSNTSVTCKVPARAAGVVDVDATNSAGADAKLDRGFTYYTPGGLDQTFGTRGQVTTDNEGGNDRSWDEIIILSGDRILLSGQLEVSGKLTLALMQYDEHGALDKTFGTGGLVSAAVPASDESWLCDHKVDAKGRIVASGNAAHTVNGRSTVVARFLSSGALDLSFGSGGITTFEMSSGDEQSCSIQVTAAGKIVVVGNTVATGSGDIIVHRLLDNGSPDPTFGTNGRVVESINSSTVAHAHVVRPDGRVVVGYVTRSGGKRIGGVLQLGASGQHDPSFGAGGKLEPLPAGASYVIINRLHLDGDDLLLVGASQATGSSLDARVWRVDAKGQLDTAFNGLGYASLDFKGRSDVGYDLVIQPDKKIVVAGDTRLGSTPASGDYLIVRLMPNGQPDASLQLSVDVSGHGDRAHAVALDSLGRIVAAGNSFDGTDYDVSLVRIWP